MSASQPRQPRGVPTGGQWRATNRPEGPVLGECDQDDNGITIDDVLDRAQDWVDDWAERQEHCSVRVERVDNSTMFVELVKRARLLCSNCGEPLGDPGPVVFLSQGEAVGTYNYQHGCGAWDTPRHVWRFVGPNEHVEEVLREMAADLDEAVEDESRAIREQAKEAAHRANADLAKELSHLADHEPERFVERVTELSATEPDTSRGEGDSYLDQDGQLVTWVPYETGDGDWAEAVTDMRPLLENHQATAELMQVRRLVVLPGDVRGYVAARQAGATHAEALEIHMARANLWEYSLARQAGATHAESMEAHRAGADLRNYSLARQAGATHAESMEAHRAGADLLAYAAARRASASHAEALARWRRPS